MVLLFFVIVFPFRENVCFAGTAFVLVLHASQIIVTVYKGNRRTEGYKEKHRKREDSRAATKGNKEGSRCWQRPGPPTSWVAELPVAHGPFQP